MELEKLLKRKARASKENGQVSIAEASNKLGNYYLDSGELQKALFEFQEESRIYSTLEKQIDYAKANRMISEVQMLLGNFVEALKHQDIYLKISRRENNLIEIQRAYATIGRCYLLRAEDETQNSQEDLKAAEKSFLKSLLICKELSKLVSKDHLMDMQARLYLNLGITKEHMQDNEESTKNFEISIKICKANELFELQHKCYMALGWNFFLKQQDSASALFTFNNALEIAKRLKDKGSKICETLLAKSELLIKNGDFQSAKQVLKKAYKIKTPVVSDHTSIEKSLKLVYSICRTEDDLVTTSSFDYKKRKQLFEKLGDASCQLKNNVKAIEFYMKMLESAELNGETGKLLSPIYVSLYQTYIDQHQHDKALEFLWKEYEIIKSEPKEACSTLVNLAEVSEMAKKDFWTVENIYQRCWTEAKKLNDIKVERNVLLKLIKLNKKHKMESLVELVEQTALDRGFDLNSTDESKETSDEPQSEEVIWEESDCELILSSDNPDSSENENNKEKDHSSAPRRKKRVMQNFRKNVKGESKLHEACITGNYQLVKLLIDQGHPINVRDNAGWLPLHEAAIHGHRDITELLLDKGGQAMINDKGGSSCDGITPLYDACSNGNLSVVQLLLERGAKVSVRTDFGENPLESLLRWFSEYGIKLNGTELQFYENVKDQLQSRLEKLGVDIKANEQSSGYSSGKTQCSRSSNKSQSRRFNPDFSDHSDDTEDPVTTKRKSSLASICPTTYAVADSADNREVIRSTRNEYKGVMDRLKNRKLSSISHSTVDYIKRRSAHLTNNEVEFEEWLDNDLEPTKKKQKFLTDSVFNQTGPSKNSSLVKSTRNSTIYSSEDETKDNQVICLNDDKSSSVDAFDLMMNQDYSNSKIKLSKKRSNSSLIGVPKKMEQASLLSAGFSRLFEQGDTATSIPQQQPDSTSITNLHEIIRKKSLEKQIIIKVQVLEEKIIVPVVKDNDLKISWLIEETARRYYCINGIRPELKLLTTDGAILLSSDPINLLLSLTEDNVIKSEVLDWKLPPLSQRYLEACCEGKVSVDPLISELLDINRASPMIDLSNQNLNASMIRPVFRALQHQNISILNLSNNFIQNDGMKYLAQALPSIKQIKSLNLSGNLLTDKGIEYLANAVEKQNCLLELVELKLDCNPLKSLRLISNLMQSVNLINLSLSCCEITSFDRINFGQLKHFNISYNQLDLISFKNLLENLSLSKLEYLNINSVSKDRRLGPSIVSFLTSDSSSVGLIELKLARLNLSENDVLDVIRALEKADQLKYLDLSYNNEITQLTLKYILFNSTSKVETLRLVACKNLYNLDHLANYELYSDNNRKHSITSLFLSISKSVAVEEDSKRRFMDTLKTLWEKYCKHLGRIKVNNHLAKLYIPREEHNSEDFFGEQIQ